MGINGEGRIIMKYVTADFDWLRGIQLPDSVSTEAEEDPYALISVVNVKSAGELNEELLVQAYSNALLQLFSSREGDIQEALQQWVAGRIRKITKRAKNSAWNTVTENTVFIGSVDGVQVAVFPPMRMSTQPEYLRKLQVSGLTAPFLNTAIPDADQLTITVDESLGMSTGKTLAQAGHAVQLFLAHGELLKVEDWLQHGASVALVKATKLNADTADVFIQDAGFTEIPAGSITCTATY
jgi:peptidyl-tRNA hydrolase